MALSGGACDARCQAFLTSVINNENAIRMRWFIKNQDRLLKNLKDCKPLSEDSKKSEKSRKSKKSQEEKKKNVGSKISTPTKNRIFSTSIMKPIDPKIRNILYEPGVESYTAAKQYFDKRYKEKPVDRFYYPECTSWIYGWHLKDHPPIPTSQVGIRQASFLSHTSSLTRDPDWYNMCQAKNPKNFNDILTY